MEPLAIWATQWSNLKDIADVEPIGEGDQGCLAEIRDVLKKYGMLERLGVALLHRHFELDEDEAVLELADLDTRTLTTRPVKLSDVGADSVGTIWMLRDGGAATMSWCRSYCRKSIVFPHEKAHQKAK